jgi:hypothetical protein
MKFDNPEIIRFRRVPVGASAVPFFHKLIGNLQEGLPRAAGWFPPFTEST